MMKLNRYFARMTLARMTLAAGIWLGVYCFPSGTVPVTASTRGGDNAQVHFQQPNTQETSAPQDRPRGGGSRPACSGSGATSACNNLGLMALMPSPETGQAWGLTIAQHPTLWFYIPDAQPNIYRMEFELWDDDNNLILQDQDLPVPATPGIISYQIASAPPLDVGKTYRWYLLLRFDPDNPSLDDYVSGRIQRITPNAELVEQLSAARLPLTQAQLLAASGIWYDTLTNLAAVYPSHPEVWSEFLEAAGLSIIAEEPLIYTPVRVHSIL